MRRAPIVLAATVAGFAGILSFHTSGTTVTLGTAGTGSTSPSTGSSSQSSTTSTHKGARGKGGASSSTASSGGAASGTTGRSGSAGAGGPSGSSGSPSASAASGGAAAPGPTTGVRSATGRAENFGYGVLAVKVTVNGSHITALKVAQPQVAEPTSQQICNEVIPMLHSEVLSAQSTRINAISGATYTSEAYAYSLQSALDKLHVR